MSDKYWMPPKQHKAVSTAAPAKKPLRCDGHPMDVLVKRREGRQREHEYIIDEAGDAEKRENKYGISETRT